MSPPQDRPLSAANGGWVGDEAIGPTYCTALAVLALTVEHRLLPIYPRDEK